MILSNLILSLAFLCSSLVPQEYKAASECEVFVKVVDGSYRNWKLEGTTLSLVGTDGSSREFLLDSTNGMLLRLDCNVGYVLTAWEPRCLNKTRKVDFNELSHHSDTIAIALEPACWGIVELPNLYFDAGEFNLRPEAEVALDGVVQTIHENPLLEFKIWAYIDYIEGEPQLDLMRAIVVKDYLVANGAEEKRLHVVNSGYGPRSIDRDFSFFKKGDVIDETFVNSLPMEKREEARQLNRRVEFSIVKK